MPLSMQDLHDIATICRLGSFRKAAENLGISQPTLSERVGRMERRLGAILFDRGKGRSRPTALAETIVSQSGGLLEQMQGFLNQLQALSGGDKGTVRLGFGPIAAYRLLETLVLRVTESAPDTTLVIHTGGAGELLEQLAAGEIDVALCDGDPGMVHPGFNREELLRDRIAAIVSPGHPLAGEAFVPMRRVFESGAIIPKLDPRYHGVVRDVMAADPLTVPGAVFCDSYWLMKALLLSGRYCTLSTVFNFAGELSSGELVEVPLAERLDHEICLYTNEWSLPLPATHAVISEIRLQSAEILREIEARAG